MYIRTYRFPLYSTGLRLLQFPPDRRPKTTIAITTMTATITTTLEDDTDHNATKAQHFTRWNRMNGLSFAQCWRNTLRHQGCGFQDFSAASTASASASTKYVVNLLVAIPPTSAEAPDPADRFRFRFRFPVRHIHPHEH